MNRETKRLMQRQSQPAKDRQEMARKMRSPRKPGEKRGIRGYLANVRSELKAVDWPTRAQLKSFATVVFVTLVLVVGLIFLLNVVFSKGVSLLYG